MLPTGFSDPNVHTVHRSPDAPHFCGTMLKFLGVLALTALVPHDFFVSILTIRHRQETSTLDLTWRMTAHDVEFALKTKAELKLGSALEHTKADSLLNRYCLEHLVLFQKDHQLDLKWVGKELEGETLFCYLQVEGVNGTDELTVSNTLLQEVFGEQQNLVHVEEQGRPTRSHTFIRGSAPHDFTAVRLK